jgi:hypothetical protein
MSQSSFNRGFVKECQICGSNNLKEFVNLGFHPAVNDFYDSEFTKDVIESYPMPILICHQCELIQLGIHVDPEKIFPHHYAYRSGTTKILIENFKNLSIDVNNLLDLNDNDLIIDIGSNDGTLLKSFKELNIRTLGVEPTGVADIAIKDGIATENIPFSYDNAIHLEKKYGKAKVITAANVFAHIENINDVVKGIDVLLEDDGIFVSENHYMSGLIETLQYDTFYHEHLRYYSLHSLNYLFDLHDLKIFDCKLIPTHGGSIRVFAARKSSNYIVTENYEKLLDKELSGNELNKKIKAFSSDIITSKIEILNTLTSLKLNNKSIVGISAPSRASTLINYVGIDNNMLDYICEVNGSLKIGKNIPGTKIPVINEDQLFIDQPDYALMLSWHIADELIPKLREKGFGGKFIIPLPKVRII